MEASIRGRRGSHCVSDDQRSRHSLTVEYNQAIPSPIAINATENFKNEFVAKASYSIAPPAKINATASAQASGSLTIHKEDSEGGPSVSRDVDAPESAQKKKPRAASDTRASIELVRIRLCRVGSDALQLNPQYASGFPRLGENGSINPRPKGKPRMDGCAISGLVIAPSSQWVALASVGAGRCELPAPVRIVP